MSDNLLPCPFCGGEGVVQKKDAEYLYNFSAVICEECDARTDWCGSAAGDSDDKAIAAWNRRATPDKESTILITPDDMYARSTGKLYVVYPPGYEAAALSTE